MCGQRWQGTYTVEGRLSFGSAALLAALPAAQKADADVLGLSHLVTGHFVLIA
jgi:hypothetical protein